MKGKLFASLVWGAATLMNAPAFATTNSPAGHEQGNIYDKCSMKCNEFANSKACQKFRQDNLICTEKKVSSGPMYTAQQLEELER